MLPNILSAIFGNMLKNPDFKITEIRFENKCVKECPKEFNGKKITVDKAKRKCRVVF